jgi:hypothetical protein
MLAAAPTSVPGPLIVKLWCATTHAEINVAATQEALVQ